MSKQNQIYNRTRHDFLLTLFPNKDLVYEEMPINGFVLIRQYNGNTKRWEVAIYTREAFARKSQFTVGSELSDTEDQLPS